MGPLRIDQPDAVWQPGWHRKDSRPYASAGGAPLRFSRRPSVSTRTWRLRPVTFLPDSRPDRAAEQRGLPASRFGRSRPDAKPSGGIAARQTVESKKIQIVWVRGCPAAASPYMRSGPYAVPHHNASCTRRSPARRDPPERHRHLATKDEDGRVSPALMPLTATLLFLRYGRVVSALISTPSGSTPVSACRQSASRSRLVIATMAIRRVRPCSVPRVRGTMWRARCRAGSAATARRAGSSPCVPEGCPPGLCFYRGPCRHSGRAWV